MIPAPVPAPVRLTVWVLPATLLVLSVTVKVAVLDPGAVGVKVTLMVQLPLAATEPPQVVVWPKSPELVPERAIPVMVKAVLPVLFRVTVCPALVVPRFWLVKVRLDAVRPATGPLPVPAKVMVWGLPVALSVMVTDAERDPGAVGEKVTLIVQLFPIVTGLPQVLVWAKSPEFVPVTVTAVIFNVAFPVLFTVTVWAVLVEPTFCALKVKFEAVRPTTGPLPVPLKPKVCGLPGALSVMLTEAVRVPTAVGVKVTVTEQLLPAPTDPPQVLV